MFIICNAAQTSDTVCKVCFSEKKSVMFPQSYRIFKHLERQHVNSKQTLQFLKCHPYPESQKSFIFRLNKSLGLCMTNCSRMPEINLI